MREGLVIALLALAAGPAAAQQQVCRSVDGGRMVCADGLEAVLQRTDRELQKRGPPRLAPQVGDAATAARAQPFITQKQQKLVAAVAKAMQEGRCDKAETLALRAADHDLAQEAARRCVPRPRAPQAQ